MFLEVKNRPVSLPLYEPWRQCLYDAAERIDSGLWDKGTRCAMNNIFAVGGDGVSEAVYHLAAAVGNVINWNDAPGQSAANVAKTMRFVASA